MPGFTAADGYVLNFTTSTIDDVNLLAGWNQISIDVTPDDADIAQVTSGLTTGNLVYVTDFKDGSAHYFDPNGPSFFNTLNNVYDGYGI